MADLDDITSNLRSKLTCGPSNIASSTSVNKLPEFDVPVTSQSGQYPLTSTQTSFTLSNFPRSQGETPRDELTYTGSHGAESSRTAGDSGQFSAEQSADKYDGDSAPVSQRSCSDRLDTLRSGVTPRDFLDSGFHHTNNNSNAEEVEQNLWLTASPRDSSDEKKDEYSESGGFSFRRTPRDSVRTPREGLPSSGDWENSLNGNQTDNGKTKTSISKSDEKNSKSEQKQMSIIQEYSENDKSESEDEADNKYYHQYRDLLDKEEDDGDDDEEDVEDEGEIVVPRRINDVSGKFSPTGEIIMLSDDITESVPYGFTSLPSHRSAENSEPTPRSGHSVGNNKNSPREAEVASEDGYSDNEMTPRNADEIQMENQEEIVFDEKDSWLSDSDKEPERDLMIGYQYMQNQGHLMKQKHQRQDSDTGYSSRDNISESYLTPSGGGTNSETDMSRLHEHEHWEQRESDDHVFPEKMKNRLLANVELESTGGSFGLRYDSTHSRISSAGSRHTRKSSEPSITESFDEKEEQIYAKRELEPIDSQPVSARTEELDNFFHEVSEKHARVTNHVLSDGESADESNDDVNENRDNNAFSGFNGHADIDGDDDDTEESNSVRSVTSQPRSSRSDGEPVPNFFMPVKHLEQSLKTLQIVTDKVCCLDFSLTLKHSIVQVIFFLNISSFCNLCEFSVQTNFLKLLHKPMWAFGKKNNLPIAHIHNFEKVH